MEINIRVNFSKEESRGQTLSILGKMDRHSEEVLKMMQCGMGHILT